MDADAGADSGAEASDRGAAWPTPGAKLVAFGAIALAGGCGGLIGWAVADLQCAGRCVAQTGVGALLGAVLAAGGVAVIAVLALQALAEWQAQEGRRRTSDGR